ncbi:MAG: hypothetical protein ACO1TE_17515 [Prosthecobacter sp.]
MTTISFFPAQCRACQHAFDAPHLGDFTYGEFLLTQERGQAFATLSACAEPAFDHIRTELLRTVPESASTDSRTGDRFLYIVARCASPMLGHGLLPHGVCPQCFSRSISLDDAIPAHGATVPATSFADFLGLKLAEQQARLRQLWVESAERV